MIERFKDFINENIELNGLNWISVFNKVFRNIDSYGVSLYLDERTYTKPEGSILYYSEVDKESIFSKIRKIFLKNNYKGIWVETLKDDDIITFTRNKQSFTFILIPSNKGFVIEVQVGL